MKHFKEFLRESSGKITITFGNFNPPNIEHETLINKVHEIAQGGSYRIYSTQECNEHFPLSYESKIKFMRKTFPRHARNIISDSKIKDLYDTLDSLYEQGYKEINLVMPNVPKELIESVNQVNGVIRETKTLYNFESINIISVDSVKDIDLENKMLEAAKNNNFELFSKTLPTTLKEGHKLFNAIRSALGLKESYNFRHHIQLASVSKEREAYIAGDLFKVGDVVEVKESKVIGQIQRLGSNYVIIETYEGIKQRKWLRDVMKVEEAFINKMIEKMGVPSWTEYMIEDLNRADINKKKKTKYKSFKQDLSTLNGK